VSDRPGRVVHCVRSDGFAGVERYIATVAPELGRRGWSVRVIGGDAATMRRELGPIPFEPAATTTAVVAQLAHCRRGELVHAHMTAAESAVLAIRMLRRVSFVSTRHFAARRGSTIGARIGAALIRRALDRQIAISQFVADSIGEPSIVLLNGVPPNDRHPAPERMVLVAQRLESEKHTQVAIDAWARSQLRHSGWRLTIAGTGRQGAELERLVEERGLHYSVELVGFHSDLPSLMAGTAIFLAPAPAEPFGFSVAEAMAAGIPVVAARGGAHVETVGVVSDRWLFPAGDSRAAAKMLDSLGSDPTERRSYGDALRDSQRKHLSISAHVDRLEEIYAEIRWEARRAT